jgi:hypothetical protein
VTVDGKPFLDVRPAPRLDADGEAIRRSVAEGKGWPELAANVRRATEAAQ